MNETKKISEVDIKKFIEVYQHWARTCPRTFTPEVIYRAPYLTIDVNVLRSNELVIVAKEIALWIRANGISEKLKRESVLR